MASRHRPSTLHLCDANPPFAERMVVAVEAEEKSFSQTAEGEAFRRQADKVEASVFWETGQAAIEGYDIASLSMKGFRKIRRYRRTADDGAGLELVRYQQLAVR